MQNYTPKESYLPTSQQIKARKLAHIIKSGILALVIVSAIVLCVSALQQIYPSTHNIYSVK